LIVSDNESLRLYYTHTDTHCESALYHVHKLTIPSVMTIDCSNNRSLISYWTFLGYITRRVGKQHVVMHAQRPSLWCKKTVAHCKNCWHCLDVWDQHVCKIICTMLICVDITLSPSRDLCCHPRPLNLPPYGLIDIVSIIRPRRSRSTAAYSHQTFPWTICRSVRRSVCVVHSGKTAVRIGMPFGIVDRTGLGMRQVMRSGDQSTGRGTFGGAFKGSPL